MDKSEIHGAVAHVLQLNQQAYNAREKAIAAQFLADEYAAEGQKQKAAQSRAECLAYQRVCDLQIDTITTVLANVAPLVGMSPVEQQAFHAAMLQSVDETKSYARTPAVKQKETKVPTKKTKKQQEFDLTCHNIATALLNYHQFDSKSNSAVVDTPIKGCALGRTAKCSNSTISKFFKEHFGSHKGYVQKIADRELGASLGALVKRWKEFEDE